MKLNVVPESTPKRINSHLTRLKELSNKVSKLNFDNESRSLTSKFQKLNPQTHVLIFSADKRFYYSFKQEKPYLTEFHSLRTVSPQMISRILHNNPKAIAVYYATGSITARRLRQISLNVRKRMFVLNTTYPGLIKNSETFAALIHLNTKNPYSGRWLAKTLFEPELPTRIPTNEAALKRRSDKGI